MAYYEEDGDVALAGLLLVSLVTGMVAASVLNKSFSETVKQARDHARTTTDGAVDKRDRRGRRARVGGFTLMRAGGLTHERAVHVHGLPIAGTLVLAVTTAASVLLMATGSMGPTVYDYWGGNFWFMSVGTTCWLMLCVEVYMESRNYVDVQPPTPSTSRRGDREATTPSYSRIGPLFFLSPGYFAFWTFVFVGGFKVLADRITTFPDDDVVYTAVPAFGTAWVIMIILMFALRVSLWQGDDTGENTTPPIAPVGDDALAEKEVIKKNASTDVDIQGRDRGEIASIIMREGWFPHERLHAPFTMTIASSPFPPPFPQNMVVMAGAINLYEVIILSMLNAVTILLIHKRTDTAVVATFAMVIVPLLLALATSLHYWSDFVYRSTAAFITVVGFAAVKNGAGDLAGADGPIGPLVNIAPYSNLSHVDGNFSAPYFATMSWGAGGFAFAYLVATVGYSLYACVRYRS